MRCISGDGEGYAGIDLERYGPGPALIADSSIRGFDYAIRAKPFDDAVTLQNPTIERERRAGIYTGQLSLAIEGLHSFHRVPPIQTASAAGHVVLVDSSLEGGSRETAAVVGPGRLLVRNLRSAGYASAIEGRPGAHVADRAEPLTLRRFWLRGIASSSGIAQDSTRPLLIEDASVGGRIVIGPRRGDVFTSEATARPEIGPGSRLFAWQLNPESERAEQLVLNDGGLLRVLGLKSEGATRVVVTRNRGLTEVLRGLIYPVWAFASDRPALVFEDSCGSVSCAETAYEESRAYATHLLETRGGATRRLERSELPRRGLARAVRSLRLEVRPVCAERSALPLRGRICGGLERRASVERALLGVTRVRTFGPTPSGSDGNSRQLKWAVHVDEGWSFTTTGACSETPRSGG